MPIFAEVGSVNNSSVALQIHPKCYWNPFFSSVKSPCYRSTLHHIIMKLPSGSSSNFLRNNEVYFNEILNSVHDQSQTRGFFLLTIKQVVFESCLELTLSNVTFTSTQYAFAKTNLCSPFCFFFLCVTSPWLSPKVGNLIKYHNSHWTWNFRKLLRKWPTALRWHILL